MEALAGVEAPSRCLETSVHFPLFVSLLTQLTYGVMSELSECCRPGSPQLLWRGDEENHDSENTRTYMVVEKKKLNCYNLSSVLHVHVYCMHIPPHTCKIHRYM